MQAATNTEQHNHTHSQNRFAVIPTPMRLNARPDYTGQGVTSVLLDSGFYPHPDLTDIVAGLFHTAEVGHNVFKAW